MYETYTMNALLMFHQGWTDIVNCLPLITWYSKQYAHLFVVIRQDAWKLGAFYVRGLSNVHPIFVPKYQLDRNWIAPLDIPRLNIGRFLLMGHFDVHRPDNDPHKDAYHRLNEVTDYPFEKLFYESYDIPYIQRVKSFDFYRDPVGEEAYYKKMVKKEPYICSHSVKTLPEGYDVVELGESTDLFFDAIRVLQHAKEIHVIDSVWAALCYLMDARYGYLQGIPVYVHCTRDFYRMFTQPVELPNWKIVGFREYASKEQNDLGS
jgi:hypothetical protein